MDSGRNAIDPIRMFKYLLLKAIFELSDADIVERSKYDMSFKYFLGMAPEEPIIDPSSLTKFRKLRLKDIDLLEWLIGKSVALAIEQNILKSSSIIVDSTHTKARYNQKGDTAYSEKDNISYTKKNELELATKLNPLITQGARKKEPLIFVQQCGYVRMPGGSLRHS